MNFIDTPQGNLWVRWFFIFNTVLSPSVNESQLTSDNQKQREDILVTSATIGSISATRECYSNHKQDQLR